MEGTLPSIQLDALPRVKAVNLDGLWRDEKRRLRRLVKSTEGVHLRNQERAFPSHLWGFEVLPALRSLPGTGF